MYYVYVHTLPNGKIYIGQTKDPVRRWCNGEGYIDNRPFYKDIQIFGWNNIRHEIIAQYSDIENALKMEAVLIVLFKAENPDFGYNQTRFYDDAIKKYASKVPINGISLEKPISDNNFAESLNLPVSACKVLIDEWIFNEKHRNIMKSRLLDGLSYNELSEMYKMSIRQLKNIVYDGCNKIESHF